MSSKLNLQSTLSFKGSNAKMPALGFGVYLSPQNVCKNSCLTALKAGYRHIDSAQYYDNESEVGQAIKESGIARKDLFITTKYFAKDSYEENLQSVLESIEKIDAAKDGYVDLFLIHSPHSGPEKRREMWRALEEGKRQGKIRDIGVSNFGIAHLKDLKSHAEVMPVVNQIELHPWNQQRDVVKYCQDNDIIIEAYCPIVRNQKANDPTLRSLAEKYKATPNQVLIRYCLQKGWSPLPKSDTPERIQQNADLYFFDIEEADMKKLDDLDEGKEGAIVEAVDNESLE